MSMIRNAAVALGLAGWLFHPAALLAAEKTVSFAVSGQKVVGTLSLPDGIVRPPVVLLLHGFESTRDELEIPSVREGVFRRAARLWSDRGLASLRIDFRGGGDSDGKFEDTTFSGQIHDALAAIDFLAASDEIDHEKISVVGWSMGGAVACAAAGRTGHKLASVSLWAPATNMTSAMTFIFGPDVMRKGLSGGDKAMTAKLSWGDQVTLGTAFFQDLFTVDPIAEIASYRGPLLVAVGTNDDIVFPQPASGKLVLDYHKGPGELWVQPMDHIFNTQQDAAMVDRLIAKTGDFIQASLK